MTAPLQDINVISLSENDIEENTFEANKEQILKGLFRGSVGFLIAPPDTGKSYLALSIAYEMALPEYPLIGLRTDEKKIFKTLVWPIEDALPGTLPRVKNHLSVFSSNVKERLKDNVAIYKQSDPICCASALRQTQEGQGAANALDALIYSAKQYDLVIIDTLRDAVGSADIVEDDYYIRVALERLAKEADVAVFVVHHPTKEVSRGKEVINSVSGSGLSSTLSKSKLHLYLDQVINKKEGIIEATRLRHIKANYVPFNEQWRVPITLYWTQYSLLYRDPYFVNQFETGILSQSERKVSKPIKKRLSRLSEEPGLIHRDDSLLSEESKRLAQQINYGPFGGGMASELSDLHTVKSSK